METVHILLHAARRLRHAPLFAVMSVLTLAIGIGASALMLSVVSTILLKPLPDEDAAQGEMQGARDQRQRRARSVASATRS